MNYRARHAALRIGAKTAARGAAIVGAAAVAAGAGVIGTGAPASATIWEPLSVTLSASQDNASATWTADGNIALKVGTDTSGSWAQVSVNLNQEEINQGNYNHERPVTPPSFTTGNFGGNSSPRWVLMLHNGNYLFGYPAQSASTGATGANDTFTGPQWQAVVDGSFYNGGAYMTYQDALAAAGDLVVDSASIVADADQAPGSVDTLTNVQYGGATVGGGVVSFRAVATQDATVGTAFSLNDSAATSSSDPNLTYNASGLPSGLSIDSSGTISGTPTRSGRYAVTVSATDVYGTTADQDFELDVSRHVGHQSTTVTETVYRQ